MSYNSFYNTKINYSSQEDDTFGMSEEDSFPDNELNSKNRNVDKESVEYQKRRQKNNEAVRKSREKAKIKYTQKEEQIQRLRIENRKLEDTAAGLRKQLDIYQDLAKNLNIHLAEEQNNKRLIKIENDAMNLGY